MSDLVGFHEVCVPQGVIKMNVRRKDDLSLHEAITSQIQRKRHDDSRLFSRHPDLCTRNVYVQLTSHDQLFQRLQELANLAVRPSGKRNMGALYTFLIRLFHTLTNLAPLGLAMASHQGFGNMDEARKPQVVNIFG